MVCLNIIPCRKKAYQALGSAIFNSVNFVGKFWKELLTVPFFLPILILFLITQRSSSVSIADFCSLTNVWSKFSYSDSPKDSVDKISVRIKCFTFRQRSIWNFGYISEILCKSCCKRLFINYLYFSLSSIRFIMFLALSSSGLEEFLIVWLIQSSVSFERATGSSHAWHIWFLICTCLIYSTSESLKSCPFWPWIKGKCSFAEVQASI